MPRASGVSPESQALSLERARRTALTARGERYASGRWSAHSVGQSDMQTSRPPALLPVLLGQIVFGLLAMTICLPSMQE